MIYNLPREIKIETPENYVLFSSADPFTISATPGWDGKIIYSIDGKTWKKWDGNEISTADTATANVIGFAGIGNTKIAGKMAAAWKITGGYVNASGNIESLLDHKTVAAGKHPTMGEACFAYMFYQCTALATVLKLPATTLSKSCYSYMFLGCTGLTIAPALPATTLASSCYANMFRNCTKLTTTPALPATILASQCYNAMFYGCTSLTTAPALPATTLASSCYANMFRNCTKLTTTPALPATTLASSCYNAMFYGCTGLTTIPVLPALQLTEYCYFLMFDGCTKIAIYSAADTSRNEYRIPESGTGTEGNNSLLNMFTNTGGNMTGTPSINTTYYTTNEIIGGTNKITTANIGNYFTVTNGSSYYFVGSGDTFTSNNNGVNSSTATTTLTALKTMEVSFGYSYSSEANYDKFTLKIGSTTVENGVSGSLTQKTWSGTVKKGEVISFTYAKDSSQSKNDDQCKFYGMTVKEVSASAFTINGTTYSFEDGMTWQDWVNSDYNTNGYKIGSIDGYSGDDLVITSDEIYVVKMVNGMEQSATDSPQAGVEYCED